MKISNFVYFVIQALHNVGGALTLVLAVLLLALALKEDAARRILWALLAVWGVQGASGASFALASYYFYGALPDLNFIALAAMGIKIACVAMAFFLCAWLLYKKHSQVSLNVKKTLAALPIIAQVSAAILRWSS